MSNRITWIGNVIHALGIDRLAVDAFISGGALPVVVTPTPNKAAVTMQTVTVAVPGTPVQGPAVAIPDGFSVVVKNRSAQGGTPIVFVGNSNPSVQVATTRVELLKGESLAYFITSMDLLFFDSDVAGCIIELTAEQ